MNIRSARKIARDLMDENGLKDWEFQFDNAKRRFGYCQHLHKTISLSKILTRMNEEDRVLNTIKHEIAHARAPKGSGHGRAWRLECLALNIEPMRCYQEVDTVVPKAPHNYKCKRCGIEFGRYKAINPLRMPHTSHRRCGGRLEKISK